MRYLEFKILKLKMHNILYSVFLLVVTLVYSIYSEHKGKRLLKAYSKEIPSLLQSGDQITLLLRPHCLRIYL